MLNVIRFFLLVLTLTATGTTTLQAAELVMIDSRACSYCAKFKREIAPDYPNTSAGQLAPLRLVSPLRKWPEDLSGVRQTTFAPVFILVDRGREVGRFFGYSGPQRFWAKLLPLLDKL